MLRKSKKVAATGGADAVPPARKFTYTEGFSDDHDFKGHVYKGGFCEEHVAIELASSVRQLLATMDLEQYAPSFIRARCAQISIANTLDARDLRELLPNAPLGHRRAILNALEQSREATGYRRIDHLVETHGSNVQQKAALRLPTAELLDALKWSSSSMSMFVALLLSIGFSGMQESATLMNPSLDNTHAGICGTKGETLGPIDCGAMLRWNAVMWFVTTLMFLVACMGQLCLTVTLAYARQEMVHNWFGYMPSLLLMPTPFTVTGSVLFFVALATRAWIVHDAFIARIETVLIMLTMSLCWVWWFLLAHVTFRDEQGYTDPLRATFSVNGLGWWKLRDNVAHQHDVDKKGRDHTKGRWSVMKESADAEGVENAFKMADANHDGILDRSEVRSILEDHRGETVSPEEVQEVLDRLDDNGNGVIDASELAQLLAEMNEEDMREREAAQAKAEAHKAKADGPKDEARLDDLDDLETIDPS